MMAEKSEFNPLIIPGDSRVAWDAVKEYFSIFLDGACQVCLETPKNERLYVHHKNGNGLDNRRGNLMGVCASCHMKLHSGKAELEIVLGDDT